MNQWTRSPRSALAGFALLCLVAMPATAQDVEPLPPPVVEPTQPPAVEAPPAPEPVPEAAAIAPSPEPPAVTPSPEPSTPVAPPAVMDTPIELPNLSRGWRDHDRQEILLWGAQVGVTPSFGGRRDSPFNLQIGVQERIDSCSFGGFCINFSGLGPAYGTVILGFIFYDIATDGLDDPTFVKVADAIGNNALIDLDMGWMFGVTDDLGLGLAVYTAVQGSQLSDSGVIEGKFGVAATSMYTGLPVLLRGRLYAGVVGEGEGGSVVAGMQGGNVNVYLHLFDTLFAGDIGPFVTGGYEVDVAEDLMVFRVNAALGLSFL